MLAKYWRLRVLNDTDQTLTYADGARIEVEMNVWKFTSGALVYADISDDMGFTSGTIAAAGESEGDVNDNTSNLYLGVEGVLKVTADLSSTDGTIYLYLEKSPDNSIWPSDGTDFDITEHMTMVCALALSTDAVDEWAARDFSF
jgi:hypothetical protein